MEKMNIKKLENFKILLLNDNIYLYVIKTVAIFEIDEQIKELLELNRNQLELDHYNGDKEELLESFERAGLVGLEERDNVDHNGVSSLVLLLSQACNLRCTYCYAEQGEYHNKGFMSKDTARDAINFIFDNSNHDTISIILFGGEPLLNYELFKFCVEYSKEKAKIVDKKVIFGTTTNGTLVNKEIADFLKINQFTITLSIDGDEKTHNQNRYDSNHIGSYATILENTKNYLDIHKITARATMTHYNTAIDEIYDHLYSLGFGSVHISPSIDMMKKEDYISLERSFNKMIAKFYKALKQKNYDYCIKNSNLLSMLNRFYAGGIREKFCGAANNMISVDINGSIFGCHRLVYYEESNYGKIDSGYETNKRDHLLSEIGNNGNNDKCIACWASSLCGGGCPAENKVANDDYKIPHSYSCDLFQKNSEALLKLYVLLTDEEKEKLFSKPKHEL